MSIPTDDPAMDAEMTPADDSWQGGWDTKEQHDHKRNELRHRSMGLSEPWISHVRESLKDLNIIDDDGQMLQVIAKWHMTEWERAVEDIERMSVEEPFDISPPSDDETRSVSAVDKPPATSTPQPKSKASAASKAKRKAIADKAKAEVAEAVAEHDEKESNS
jgi:hypothetical protein